MLYKNVIGKSGQGTDEFHKFNIWGTFSKIESTYIMVIYLTEESLTAIFLYAPYESLHGRTDKGKSLLSNVECLYIKKMLVVSELQKNRGLCEI